MKKKLSLLMIVFMAVAAFAIQVGKRASATTWTVAGNSTELFGSAWDPTAIANDMTLDGDVYKWTKTDVALPAFTEVQFKVCGDHAWTVAFPAENYVFTIPENGKYTVVITFNAATEEITATATKTGDATFPDAEITKVQICGATDASWTNRIDFDLTKGEGNVYTGVLDASAYEDDVEFKLVVNGDTWIGFDQLTMNAPDGWVEKPEGNNNFLLKNSSTRYKSYNITATWVSNALAIKGWTVKIEGKEPRTKDVTISPASGDISEAINAELGSNYFAKNVTINLAENGAYTLSSSIVAAGNVIINGAAGAVIDASALTAPFIALSAEPTAAFLPKNDGSGVTDYYGIDKVDINNVKVTGLKQSIFWDSNKKYCVVDFKIDNCVFALATEAVKNEALISFQAGGAKDFTVKNSTISGNNAVAKYFLRYNNSARIDRYGFVQAADTWSFTYENNTFYGLLKSDGQWGNYNGLTQKTSQFVLAINNNIWVDCDAQTMRRLNHSKNFSAFNAASTMANNVFNREGAVVDQGTYGNGSDINGVVTFTDAAAGNFNGTLGTETAPTTEKTAVGDTEWTITNKQVPANIVISPAEGDITAALATAAEGKIVGNVTINLTADAKYTVSGSIVAGGSVVINGATGAVIDASALTAPFIALAAEPTAPFLPKNDGSGDTDYYGIDKVDINNVKVTGLKQSIFWDSNKKYCVVDFKIDNCVFALVTEAVKNEALISFQAGGAKDFTVKNSTISGNNAVAKYFLRYNNSARIDRYGFVQAADTWSFTYENNTFYGLLKSDGQWGNYNGLTQKTSQFVLAINNNIWVDCDAQTMRRLNHSKNFSAFNAASTMANNVFNREGAVVDQGTYGNGSDINGIVAFEDATNGDFNGKLTLAPGTTVPATMPGDKSRWTLTPVQTVTTAASGYTTLVSVCPLDFTTAAGLTAYVVAADEDIDITNSKVKLTQVTEAAANTPVILLGTASTDYTITVKADAAAVTGNLLKGSATAATTLTAGEAYLLKDGKFGLCAAGDLPAGKAYLPKPAGSASNELIIVIDGEVTGIDKVVTRDALENAKIYNLQGQEVKKAGKGIYIINGKKVVMK